VADKRILCWADWICNNPTQPNLKPINTFEEHFLPYASNCLFGGVCDPTSACENFNQGWSSSGGQTTVPQINNPYNTGTKANVYNPNLDKDSSPQNLCGTSYPVDLSPV